MTEYVDYAEYYDFDNEDPGDLPFYLAFAEQCGSPILELACGTGRLLAPMAQAGNAMYGLDLSENMLAVCRQRLDQLGLDRQVALFHADMARFDLPRKDFRLIYIPVRSFMHLFTPEDQRACLARTLDHLRPGGKFIVDVYAPDYAMLAQPPDGPFIERRRFSLPNGDRVIRQDRFVRNDPASQIQHFEIRFEQHAPDGRLSAPARSPWPPAIPFATNWSCFWSRPASRRWSSTATMQKIRLMGRAKLSLWPGGLPAEGADTGADC